jgi:hypothetical protein
MFELCAGLLVVIGKRLEIEELYNKGTRHKANWRDF